MAGDATATLLKKHKVEPFASATHYSDAGPTIALSHKVHKPVRNFIQRCLADPQFSGKVSEKTVDLELCAILGYCWVVETDNKTRLLLLDEIIENLRAKIQPSTVYSPMFNMRVHVDNFSIGDVQFHKAEPNARDFMVHRMNDGCQLKEEEQAPHSVFRGADKAFVVASVVVECDIAHASELASKRIGEAIGLLHAFSGWMVSGDQKPKPDSNLVTATSLLAVSSNKSYRIANRRDRITDLSITDKFCEHISTHWNFAYLSNLLRTPLEPRTELEEALVRAIAWAGKGALSQDPVAAILFFCIVLENLTTGTKRGDLTDSVARTVAMILHTDPLNRHKIYDDVKKIYNLRSNIVHRGVASVEEMDLLIAEGFALGLIIELSKRTNEFDSLDDIHKWVIAETFRCS